MTPTAPLPCRSTSSPGGLPRSLSWSPRHLPPRSAREPLRAPCWAVPAMLLTFQGESRSPLSSHCGSSTRQTWNCSRPHATVQAPQWGDSLLTAPWSGSLGCTARVTWFLSWGSHPQLGATNKGFVVAETGNARRCGQAIITEAHSDKKRGDFFYVIEILNSVSTPGGACVQESGPFSSQRYLKAFRATI